jgi:DNA polymerase III delta prime subunit
MKLIEHINKDNLHHAYLIEGDREEVVAEVISIMEGLGIEVSGNSDFVRVSADSFKVDDARNLKSFAGERVSSAGKKIFLISANNFLLEAQNTLLKMFEEPIENTHFFLTVPDTSALLGTFLSRFYVIKTKKEVDSLQAEEFIKMPLARRIDFVKELLQESEDEDEEGNEIIVLNSARAKALKFLNALEASIHSKFFKNPSGLLQSATGTFPAQDSLKTCISQIFQVRKFLRMPGSSAKSLMESVALVVPKF